MKSADKVQFEFLSDLEVHHKPSGAKVSTYKYPDPNDSCSSIHANWGRADELGYDIENLKTIACDLLRERAKKLAS